MQVLTDALVKSPKLRVLELAKVLSKGLALWDNDFEKRELGTKALQAYDYSNDPEMEKYLLKEDEVGKYYRNLIFRDDSIMLKNIIWNPLVATPIHGHNSRGCWVIVTKGELIEKVFTRVDGKPKMIDQRILKEGGITYNHNAIGFHMMLNSSKTTPAITLHWYHPPYDTTAIMKGTGEIFNGPLSNYSKYGKVEATIDRSGV